MTHRADRETGDAVSRETRGANLENATGNAKAGKWIETGAPKESATAKQVPL